MEIPTSLFEKLLFNTVRIEATLKDGSQISGTGFFFDYTIEEQHFYFLVTNKHVIENTDQANLVFNLQVNGKPALGKTFCLNITDFESAWFPHPKKNIDIAAMKFAPVLNFLDEKGIQIFIQPFDQSLIPSEKVINEEIDAVEDIIFIGYPNSIYDKKNLIPIVRKGITATPFSVDFEGEPIFLIDGSIFPGSSGSPVFLYDRGSYSPKGKVLIAGSRIFFLGVVTSCYIINGNNQIESVDVPIKTEPIIITSQLINLGRVIKSKAVKELIEYILKKEGVEI